MRARQLPPGHTAPAHRSSLGRARACAPLVSAGGALAVLASVTGLALGAGSTSTLKAARSATLGEIVVTPGGRTVYALAPETAHHLLCSSSQCLQFWPPVTVPSTHAKLRRGAGVVGRLAILRRSNGMLQVTLAGHPLYRFAGDGGAGQTHGQGIMSFGGRWHVISAHAVAGSAPAASPTPGPATPGY